MAKTPHKSTNGQRPRTAAPAQSGTGKFVVKSGTGGRTASQTNSQRAKPSADQLLQRAWKTTYANRTKRTDAKASRAR